MGNGNGWVSNGWQQCQHHVDVRDDQGVDPAGASSPTRSRFVNPRTTCNRVGGTKEDDDIADCGGGV